MYSVEFVGENHGTASAGLDRKERAVADRRDTRDARGASYNGDAEANRSGTREIAGKKSDLVIEFADNAAFVRRGRDTGIKIRAAAQADAKCGAERHLRSEIPRRVWKINEPRHSDDGVGLR